MPNDEALRFLRSATDALATAREAALTAQNHANRAAAEVARAEQMLTIVESCIRTTQEPDHAP